MVGKIGILALQGAFAKHREMLDRLGIASIEVRSAYELEQCAGLIIPGGESTTMLSLNTLPLSTYDKPIFGTCAGMILMQRLKLLNVAVERNAYGRQNCSFSASVTVALNTPHTFHAIFIRAPRITALYSPQIAILAEYDHSPILVREGAYLAATFHPELTNDPSIHHYFVQLCKEKQSPQLPLTTTLIKSSQTT